ncbi:hypothetical protein ACWEPC_57030, partial [Nonomuraea sp. NPDC004297]
MTKRSLADQQPRFPIAAAQHVCDELQWVIDSARPVELFSRKPFRLSRVNDVSAHIPLGANTMRRRWAAALAA